MCHDAHPEFGDNQSNAIRTMSLGPESGDSSLCKQFPFNIPQYSESSDGTPALLIKLLIKPR